MKYNVYNPNWNDLRSFSSSCLFHYYSMQFIQSTVKQTFTCDIPYIVNSKQVNRIESVELDTLCLMHISDNAVRLLGLVPFPVFPFSLSTLTATVLAVIV